jgi:hypothetical protein
MTRVTWTSDERTDVTFSLPSEHASARCVGACVQSLQDQGAGCTVRTALGYWAGQEEHACVLSIVGCAPTDERIATILRTCALQGCAFVQVEYWAEDGYSVHEVDVRTSSDAPRDTVLA